MTGPLSTTGKLLTALNLTLSPCGKQETGRPKTLHEQAVQAGQQLQHFEAAVLAKAAAAAAAAIVHAEVAVSQQDAASQLTLAGTCMRPMNLLETEQVARNLPLHAHVRGLSHQRFLASWYFQLTHDRLQMSPSWQRLRLLPMLQPPVQQYTWLLTWAQP